jgi:hypothetical protein
VSSFRDSLFFVSVVSTRGFLIVCSSQLTRQLWRGPGGRHPARTPLVADPLQVLVSRRAGELLMWMRHLPDDDYEHASPVKNDKNGLFREV